MLDYRLRICCFNKWPKSFVKCSYHLIFPPADWEFQEIYILANTWYFLALYFILVMLVVWNFCLKRVENLAFVLHVIFNLFDTAFSDFNSKKKKLGKCIKKIKPTLSHHYSHYIICFNSSPHSQKWSFA